jgi:hypothetical protein
MPVYLFVILVKHQEKIVKTVDIYHVCDTYYNVLNMMTHAL